MTDPLNTATNRITLDGEMHTQMEEISAPEKKGDGMYLFTTKTCPNCKLAKEFLKDVSYEIVDAEENTAMVDTYGIMQAPTLVVVNNGEVKKYVNASEIKGYVQDLR
jgi:ribonucleoside-triphosphate reductase